MNRLDLQLIVDKIKDICRAESGQSVALHEPCFRGKEWQYVKECLDTAWVSSAGEYVNIFEKELEKITGAKRVVVTVNGTAALYLCFLLLGLQPGDEVLIPSLTFVATANAIHYCQAIPHFVDSDEYSLGINPGKLNRYLEQICELRPEGCYNRFSKRYIRALVPVHAFGHPVDMEPILDIGRRFGLAIIEDAAESLGSLYKGVHTGTIGDLGIISFNGNKIVTTGGGGVLLTGNDELAERARHLSTTAKQAHRWAFFHDAPAFNYRMPNLNAALGCAQLEQLPNFIRWKRALAQQYQDVFDNLEGVKVFNEAGYARSNYWLNTLLLDEDYAWQRDDLLALTHENGILTRPAWTLMHRLPMYKDCPHMDLSEAEKLERRIISLPSSAFLGEPYA